MSQSDGGLGAGYRSAFATFLSLTPAVSVLLQGCWQQNVFLFLHAFCERSVVIAGEHWNCCLRKDRSSIKVGGNDMHGAATDRHPRVKGLSHSIESTETW